MILFDNWEYELNHKFFEYLRVRHAQFNKDRFFVDSYENYILGPEVVRVLREVDIACTRIGISLSA